MSLLINRDKTLKEVRAEMDLRKQVLQNRLFWLGAGFVLLFGAVTARFYQLQILNGADSRAEFADQITCE